MTTTHDATTESLSDLEDGLSRDQKRSIKKTFETEAELEEYIQEERERRKRERQRRLEKELKEAQKAEQEQLQDAKDTAEEEFNNDYNDNLDTDLSRNTARVKRVSPYRNSFRITLTTREGKEFTETLDFALPEDTGSDWVKLCNWCDTDPERPTELRGKIVPTTIANHRSGRDLDIPPIKAGLHPFAYKLRRSLRHAATTQTGKLVCDYTIASAPWWGSALWFGISIGLFFGIVYVSSPPLEGLNNLFVFPLIPLAASLVLSGWYTLKYWGGGLLYLLFVFLLRPIVHLIFWCFFFVWNMLFPSASTEGDAVG